MIATKKTFRSGTFSTPTPVYSSYRDSLSCGRKLLTVKDVSQGPHCRSSVPQKAAMLPRASFFSFSICPDRSEVPLCRPWEAWLPSIACGHRLAERDYSSLLRINTPPTILPERVGFANRSSFASNDCPHGPVGVSVFKRLREAAALHFMLKEPSPSHRLQKGKANRPSGLLGR